VLSGVGRSRRLKRREYEGERRTKEKGAKGSEFVMELIPLPKTDARSRKEAMAIAFTPSRFRIAREGIEKTTASGLKKGGVPLGEAGGKAGRRIFYRGIYPS